MRIIIRETPSKVAEYVATYVKDRILEFKPTAEKPFVLGILNFSIDLNKVYQPVLLLLERTKN
jgi:hypothetical protein